MGIQCKKHAMALARLGGSSGGRRWASDQCPGDMRLTDVQMDRSAGLWQPAASCAG